MTRARDKASAVVANFASTGVDDNADATAITIDSSENVAIGTTTVATGKLAVEGGIYLSGSSNFLRFGANSSTTTGVAIHRPAANTIAFVTSSAERARVTDNGITFNGDTATANALDDYEEGTFTPVIKYGAGSSFTTITSPNNAIGAYRKIGALLYISFYVYKNSSPIGGSGGTWRVQGIPFTLVTGSTGGYQSIPVGYWSLNGTNYFNSIPTRWQANGSDFLDMYGAQATTAWSSGNYEVAGHGVLMTS